MMTDKEMQSEIDRLNGVLADMKARKNNKSLSLKVSEKGAVSVYGLGRFPVTLYKSQMSKLIEFVPEISRFMVEHDTELKVKE